MKELSIEQKAKAYDEAKARMSKAYNDNRCTIGFMNEIFPELAESEDERMIKSINRLIRYYHDVNFPTPEGLNRKDLLDWIEKQSKQKPADKVEPKFKVGDWVMLDRPVLITKVKDMPYNIHEYWTSEGTWFGSAAKAKLWTIQDAKDGDVLACDNEDKVFIYNGKLDLKDRVCAYCGIYKAYDELRFTECAIGNYFTYKEPHPATKEQRDLLFQKMKEASYEWDADKKELKKIKQKSVEWSEKDEKNLNDAIDACKARYGNMSYTVDWLKSLKDRIQPQQEWSEEDEKRLDNAIIQLQAASHIIFEDEVNDSITFIKSLKDKVQPKQEWSEEDNRKIDELIALCKGRKKLCSPTVSAYKRMDELKEWLKSLRPQNWTKEDKERYKSCLQRLSTGNPEQPETINSKWFKEHVYPKPQSTWRPSDRQIEILKDFLFHISKEVPEKVVLVSLYHDLLKLKG